jgi:4-hydroxy-3-polyprenylbenzoate decarboxylase
MAALRLLADLPRAAPKILVAVDDDVEPGDAEAVNWAMSYRIQPHRDVEIRDAKTSTALDYSLAPPSNRTAAAAAKSSALLIDATRKWEYPPTSLPKREFMEKAAKIWRELCLPELHLKSPWFGSDLGSWSEENEADAGRATRGTLRHRRVEEKEARAR